jgi:hypothetical protein
MQDSVISKEEQKMLKVCRAGIIIITLCAAVAACAGEIPVPTGSTVVKQDRRKVAGSEMAFGFYTSALDAGAIKQFYRTQLGSLGWKEQNLLGDLAKIPNYKPDAKVTEALQQNLMFEKDGQQTVINFMPAAGGADNLTRFTVAQGILNTAPVTDESDYTPELLDEPTHDVAPVFPSAKLVSLAEDEKTMRATYVAKGSIEEAAQFYKEQMPSKGWELRSEGQPQNVNGSDANAPDVSQYCPTCPQKSAAAAKDAKVDMRWSELVFANGEGAGLRVGLFRVVSKEKNQQDALNFTTIVVNYEEPK